MKESGEKPCRYFKREILLDKILDRRGRSYVNNIKEIKLDSAIYNYTYLRQFLACFNVVVQCFIQPNILLVN